MTANKATLKPTSSPDLLARYECNRYNYLDRDYYDRHVVFDHVVGLERAIQRERFEAVAHTICNTLTQHAILRVLWHKWSNI